MFRLITAHQLVANGRDKEDTKGIIGKRIGVQTGKGEEITGGGITRKDTVALV